MVGESRSEEVRKRLQPTRIKPGCIISIVEIV